jgi:predicted GIY-YIG superfamily endonuclease
MPGASNYYIYLLASGRHGTLYIGVTNDLRTRLERHRLFAGTTQKLTSPTRACRRNNWRKIFRRIAFGWPRSARRARHLRER